MLTESRSLTGSGDLRARDLAALSRYVRRWWDRLTVVIGLAFGFLALLGARNAATWFFIVAGWRIALEALTYLRCRKHPGLGAFRVTLTDDGVDLANFRGTSHQSWDYFTGLEETRTLLILRSAVNRIGIPKRLFGPQVAEARRLAAGGLKRRPHDPGPVLIPPPTGVEAGAIAGWGQLTAEDLLASAHRMALRIYVVALVWGGAWAAIDLVLHGSPWWGLGFATVFVSLLEVRIQIMCRRHPQLGPVALTLTEEGVTGVTGRLQSNQPWDGFQSYRETPTTFILRRSRTQWQVFQKRYFAPADLWRVRDLLDRKVPRQQRRW